MRILHALICFFLSLQDGATAGVNAEVSVYTRTKGENIIVNKCSSSSTGSSKIFCKETCDRGNVLIETTESRAQRGRYSLGYEDGSGGHLSVSIKQLRTSDSGLYRCGLGSSSSSASLMEFEIIVIDALLNRHNSASAVKSLSATSGEDLTVACVFASAGQGFVFCKNDCKDKDILAGSSGVRDTRGRFSVRYLEEKVYVSIRQLRESDSGLYTCVLDRGYISAIHQDFSLVVTDATPTKPDLTLQTFSTTVPENPRPPTPPQNETIRTTKQPQRETPTGGVHLCVILSLVVLVVLSSLTVLIVCIKRKSKRSGLISRQDDTSVEFPVYENQLPGCTFDESTYQSIDPATRDQNQIYFTLTAKQQDTGNFMISLLDFIIEPQDFTVYVGTEKSRKHFAIDHAGGLIWKDPSILVHICLMGQRSIIQVSRLVY